MFSMHPSSTPWKRQKTSRFSDVFWGWRKDALGTNRLMVIYFFTHSGKDSLLNILSELNNACMFFQWCINTRFQVRLRSSKWKFCWFMILNNLIYIGLGFVSFNIKQTQPTFPFLNLTTRTREQYVKSVQS